MDLFTFPISDNGRRQHCRVWFILFSLALAIFVAVASGEVFAQGVSPLRGKVVATEENGHARLVFTFPQPVKFERTLANGVLVLSLETAVDVDLANIAISVPSYIVAARSDPGGTSLRFALARRLTVAVLPAAERLFVDLLPEEWKGPLPTLPKEVLEELAARAQLVEETKRRTRNGVSTLSSVPLTLRVGRYPTFSRVVFEWNDAVETTLSRAGNTVKIKFNRPGEVDITRLNVDPPPNVRGARMTTEDGRTEVEIDVAVGADVRGFRENTSYVLDIATDDGLGLDRTDLVIGESSSAALPPVPTGDEEIRFAGRDAPETPAAASQPMPVRESLLSAQSDANPADSEVSDATEPGQDNDNSPPAVVRSGNLEISVSPLVIGGEAPASSPPALPSQSEQRSASVTKPAENRLDQVSDPASRPAADSKPGLDTGGEMTAQAEQHPPVETPVNEAPAAGAPADNPAEDDADGTELAEVPPGQGGEPQVSAPLAASKAAEKPGTPVDARLGSVFDGLDDTGLDVLSPPDKPAGKKNRVKAKIVGETLRLTLPFGSPVAGAVFQRAQTLWMVFDTDAELNFDAISEAGDGRVQDISVVVSGRMQVIKLMLDRRYLATARPHRRDWVISVGDLVLDPTVPVSLERALRADGRSKVVAKLPGNGHVHWISDSEIGDQLAVVTAFGPARGLIKRQQFVEFTALPTAHGLVIKPSADDLAVRTAFSDVVITRDSGLTVSAGRRQGYVPGHKGTSDATRPGFVDFGEWKQGSDDKYRFHVNRLVRAISQASLEKRSGARLELGRLFLAHQLGAEAKGMLQLGIEEDPEIENDPVFRAMRGVASVFLNHLKEAESDFAVHGLGQDPHSALWRGVIAAHQGDWRKALLAFDDGAVALDAYPADQQSHFRLGAARAALMSNDLETATRHIDALPDGDLGAIEQRQARLLRGLLARALGDSVQALSIFREIENGPWGPEAAEAKFNRVGLEIESGKLPGAQAIEILETLAISWRGDRIELSVMKKLAELHAGSGNYLRALGIMREAVIAHNGEERTRQIHEDMTRIFERLFLENGVEEIKPLKALSLYYEFRELTPVGRRGDELIRKLVRRLIEVDLLGQAAELLDHQVENRLSGAARAQVASDLSLIYLMNHKPELALRAIRRTRQAVLPASLQQKRNILEARALAELGRVEIAVELLDSMSGADIEELKADALWRGKRWQQAGLQIEKMLGDSWQDTEAFSDADRLNVMRAGISFVLADDRAGTERLRRKYIAKMASSPDAVNFDVVTKIGQNKGIEFNNLATEIAEIGTLSTFIENFRKRYGEAGAKPLGETSDARGDTANQNG